MAKIFKPSVKTNNLGKKETFTIDRLDLNGAGVSRYRNKPFFIDGALPNEKVIAKISEDKSKYGRAELVSVVSESQQRIVPNCQHVRQCGGCDLQHLAADAQLLFKQQKVSELFTRNNIKDQLPWQKPIAEQQWHYRRKARIGVQYNKLGQAIVGFRKKQSNQLQPIKSCPVLEQSVSNIFPLLSKIINQLTLSKSIGHIEVLVTDVLTIVVRQLKPLNESDKAIWLAAAEEHKWQVLVDNGGETVELTECSPLSYRLNEDINIEFTSSDFVQVNHQVNLAMVGQALQWLSLNEDDKVLDLFCGLGNFSLPIAKQVEQVVGVEGIQAMVDKAQGNAKRNNIANACFYQSDLNASWQGQPWLTHSYNKILLDPARAGAFEAVTQMLELRPEKVLYVSCDPSTLARDSQQLVTQGYHIEKISIMDMFSQTKHVETMVLFVRNNTK